MSHRPAPPPHNTPNSGRTRKYHQLVEPSAPQKRERLTAAALVAAGGAAVAMIDILLRVFA